MLRKRLARIVVTRPLAVVAPPRLDQFTRSICVLLHGRRPTLATGTQSSLIRALTTSAV